MKIFLMALFTVVIASAQKPEYAVFLIPDSLKESANAVVRLNEVNVNISSRGSLNIQTVRVVTILNEYGLKNVDATEFRNVTSIQAVVYDAFGNEIKKIKRKEFREVSISEGSIITDNKTTFLDYTPTQYPFTIVYSSEVSDGNTAFLPDFRPIYEPFVSVERAVMTISYASNLGFKYKEYNFEGAKIVKKEEAGKITFTAENIPGLRNEQYSPPISKMVPYVLFGLEQFRLEGVDGTATSWENFGSWIYNSFLVGTDEIPLATQKKVLDLVGSETDPIKQAKIIYSYVQQKSRYVSIQVGIGGWKPMKAKDVDRLGYGDCKALTNYTRSLLQVVGVPSYYAIVCGDVLKKDLEKDFVSMQGNHIILAIPDGEKLIWLECTSQTLPFGFQGDFTDDRLALLVKPTGGVLTRTSVYDGIGNSQISKGKYQIDALGTVLGTVEIKSKGTQYDTKSALEGKSPLELEKFYKEYFLINNLKLNKVNISNNRDDVEFTESISLHADRYGNPDSNRIIFPINAYNQYSRIPQRYRTRTNPFEIARGFMDYDEITVEIPTGYTVEAKPGTISFKDKYGEYTAEFIAVDSKQILYKRTLKINAGYYENKDYESYRKFMEQVSKSDNSKMILVKT